MQCWPRNTTFAKANSSFRPIDFACLFVHDTVELLNERDGITSGCEWPIKISIHYDYEALVPLSRQTVINKQYSTRLIRRLQRRKHLGISMPRIWKRFKQFLQCKAEIQAATCPNPGLWIMKAPSTGRTEIMVKSKKVESSRMISKDILIDHDFWNHWTDTVLYYPQRDNGMNQNYFLQDLYWASKRKRTTNLLWNN